MKLVLYKVCAIYDKARAEKKGVGETCVEITIHTITRSTAKPGPSPRHSVTGDAHMRENTSGG